MFPHPNHRCHAADRPITIDLVRQTSQCLSSTFTACERYVGHQRQVPGQTGAPPIDPRIGGASRAERSG
jgi:hypothetical protein